MFKQTIKIFAIVLLLAGVARGAGWELDKAHSSVGFSVQHLVISNVKGSFGDFTGFFDFDPGKLEEGKVEMTVHVASINTDDVKRDEHLRSADFFDAENYPVMTFKSSKVHDVSGKNFKITGDLTIRGVTKVVTFDGTFNGVIDDPWGNTKAGFSVTTRINRQDFEVKWNKTLDAGGVVVGDEVTISLELELGKIK